MRDKRPIADDYFPENISNKLNDQKIIANEYSNVANQNETKTWRGKKK